MLASYSTSRLFRGEVHVAVATSDQVAPDAHCSFGALGIGPRSVQDALAFAKPPRTNRSTTSPPRRPRPRVRWAILSPRGSLLRSRRCVAAAGRQIINLTTDEFVTFASQSAREGAIAASILERTIMPIPLASPRFAGVSPKQASAGQRSCPGCARCG